MSSMNVDEARSLAPPRGLRPLRRERRVSALLRPKDMTKVRGLRGEKGGRREKTKEKKIRPSLGLCYPRSQRLPPPLFDKKNDSTLPASPPSSSPETPASSSLPPGTPRSGGGRSVTVAVALAVAAAAAAKEEKRRLLLLSPLPFLLPLPGTETG